MSVPSTAVEFSTTGVVVNTPIVYGLYTYDLSWIKVRYGSLKQDAVYGVDYTVEWDDPLDPSYTSVTVTPLASLLAKIAVNGTNVIYVRRELPLTSAFDATNAAKRADVVEHFDKTLWQIQQVDFKVTDLVAYVTIVQDAAASAILAANSATAAAASETAAAASEAAAATSETNAAASATAAAASATAAALSATAASDSETAAAASEAAAAASATAAAGSATAAATSATNAATSASAAATSATNAATSETNAATSETNAAASATAAAASAAAAALDAASLNIEAPTAADVGKMLEVNATYDGFDLVSDVPRYGFRNVLPNGGFQVAQRGTGFTSTSTPWANDDDTYLADGAVLLSDGNDIVDVSIYPDDTFTGQTESGGALRAQIETTGKKFGWLFPVENKNCQQIIKAGKASLQLKTSVQSGFTSIRIMLLAWTGAVDAITSDVIAAWNAFGAAPTLAANWTDEIGGGATAISSANGWEQHNFEDIDVDTSGVKNLAVLVVIDNSPTIDQYFYVADVQLEAGPYCTKYEHRPYQVDYEMCRHYFKRINLAGIEYGVPSKNGTGAVQLYWSHDFEPMRTAPAAYVENLAVSTDSIGSFSVGHGRVRWRTTNSLAAGTTAVASGSFDLSAEL